MKSSESLLYHLSNVMSSGLRVSGGSEVESVMLEMLVEGNLYDYSMYNNGCIVFMTDHDSACHFPAQSGLESLRTPVRNSD